MTTTHELPPIELLVLARLLVGGEKGATIRAVTKDVGPLLEHRLAGSALSGRIARALDDLAGRGLAGLSRSKAGAITKAFATDRGKEEAIDVLSIHPIPAKMTWDAIKKGYLAAAALDLPAPRGAALKQFTSAPGYKAALLRKARNLPITDEFPTKKKADDALFWQLLGIDSSEEFSLNTIKNALLNRELKSSKNVEKPDTGVALLLARSVGARSADVKELINAPIRSWVDGGELAPPPQSIESPPADDLATPLFSTIPAPEQPPLSLDEFARRVREAARDCPTGRFGANRVFIAHVLRTLENDPDFDGMGPAAFKQRLAEANNARLLDLSRADLVQAMDPKDVRESEVEYYGATFHFIRI